MKVLIAVGQFTLVAHYRALGVGNDTRVTWELQMAQERQNDGSRRTLEPEEVDYLALKLEDHIERAILMHHTTPDEFGAWLKTQPQTIHNGGFMTYEDAIALARAAYGTAHALD